MELVGATLGLAFTLLLNQSHFKWLVSRSKHRTASLEQATTASEDKVVQFAFLSVDKSTAWETSKRKKIILVNEWVLVGICKNVPPLFFILNK